MPGAVHYTKAIGKKPNYQRSCSAVLQQGVLAPLRWWRMSYNRRQELCEVPHKQHGDTGCVSCPRAQRAHPTDQPGSAPSHAQHGLTERGSTKARELSCCSKVVKDLEAPSWRLGGREAAPSMGEGLTTQPGTAREPQLRCRTASAAFSTHQRPAQCSVRKPLPHTPWTRGGSVLLRNQGMCRPPGKGPLHCFSQTERQPAPFCSCGGLCNHFPWPGCSWGPRKEEAPQELRETKLLFIFTIKSRTSPKFHEPW